MDIRYFLGANSADGFHSHFDQLLPTPQRKLLRILKGGSGCGKSTLMKKVAAYGEQLGLSVERILCSSDPDSLDGIAIPEIGYAIVDGTAPHVVEPKLCGCTETYLDLSPGYDTAGLRSIRPALSELRTRKLACFSDATACLRAAAFISELRRNDDGLNEKAAADICEKELPNRGGYGSKRTVFFSGYTPLGKLDLDAAAVLCKKCYILSDTPTSAAFLRRIAETAVSRGWNCLIGDSPLLPGRRWEQLLIPELELGFLTDSVQISDSIPQITALTSHECNFKNENLQKELIEQATLRLCQAKEHHELLEQLCLPFFDFSIADRAALECCAELDLQFSCQKQ